MPHISWKSLVDFAYLIYHLWRWNNRGFRESLIEFGLISKNGSSWKFPQTPRMPGRPLLSSWRETVLRYYLETSDVNGLKSLFDHGVSVHTEIGGQALIGWAIEKSDPRLALFLLANGADPDSLDRHAEPVLFAAIGKAVASPASGPVDLPDFLVVIEALLEKGADVHQLNPSGYSPVYAASNGDNLPLLQLLLDYGADVNRGAGKESPLAVAVMMNRLETARYLLDHEAAITRDSSNEPLLSTAIESKDLPMVELLLEYGAKTREPDSCGNTPLFKNAIFARHEGIADALLRAGADINERSSYGDGLIHVGLVDFGTVEDMHWFDFLLKRGADIDMKNDADMTPLEYSLMVKNSVASEYLLSHGASLNDSDPGKISPLEHSISRNRPGRVKIPLKYQDDSYQKQDLFIRITNILRRVQYASVHESWPGKTG